MKVDKSKWHHIFFSDCTYTVKVKDAIQKKDYHIEGKYPIISQEKDFISGYCDNIECLNSIGEVVIFGDHTRVLKFIDFDFCVGADGVKVIKPIDELSAKYLYYFLTWAKIPSNGYSRHFKFLKEVNVKYPSLESQTSIVAELDAIQAMIDGYREQLADLDRLAQSIFLDTFGDPITNPKGWEIIQLENVCDIFGRIGFRGYTKADFVNSPTEGCITLSPSNIDGLNMDYSKCSYISWHKYDESPEIKIFNGDILVVKTGSSYGKCALVRNLPHDATINPQFVVLKNIKCNNIYLVHLLSSDLATMQYEGFVGGAAIPTFSQSNMKKMKFPFPPLSLQQQFAAQVEAIERQKEGVRQQLADAETLMAERMQYYFS